jgi:hypothetical protein
MSISLICNRYHACIHVQSVDSIFVVNEFSLKCNVHQFAQHFWSGASPPGSFNVSGAPSAQYSSVSTTFASGGYTPGTSVVFTITSADSQGIVPSTQIQGPFPFSVVLNQLDSSSGISYPVPFTSASLVGGIWRVTCTPTRFLNVTGNSQQSIFK